MGTLVVRGRLAQGERASDIVIEDGVIQGIQAAAKAKTGVLGGADRIVTQGFFDLQVNGFAGVDFNRPTVTPQQLRRATEVMWRHGVTRYLPTVITAPVKDMLGTMDAIAQARQSDPALAFAIAGMHVEGPFLAPEDGPRGAHPADAILDPDWELFLKFQDAAKGHIRLLSLAPERPGAIGLIWQLRQAGVVVAITHTDGGESDINQAVQAGAQLSSHLGNGAHALLPRHRNYVQMQLANDELFASIIVDGHHLPHYFVKNVVRAKGLDRLILITDAMAAAAAAPGKYRLGQVLAEVGPDGYVRLPGTPYLAGSALTMDRAIENVAKFSGITLDQAIPLANRQPRRLFPDMPGLAPGAPAEVVVLRPGPAVTVEATIVQGDVVYRAS